jgi:ribosomal protein L16 Arg81 hydroxylase
VNDLRSLLAPLLLDAFADTVWDRHPLHVPGAADRFDGLFGPADLDRVIAEGKGRFRANRLDAARIPDAEERVWSDVSAGDVRALLDAGATIAASDLARVDPRAARVARMIKRDLGFAGGVSATAWLSTDGYGVAPHFDATSSFVLQIQGTKVWRVSPEPALAWPRKHGVLLGDGAMVYTTDDGEELEQDDWEIPATPTPPESLVAVRLEPGDLFYVPAGTWHCTEASGGPSASLNVHLAPVGFLDLLGPALQALLQRDPAWRRLPIAPGCPPAGMPDRIREFLDARLSELGPAIARLRNSPELERAWQDARVGFAGPLPPVDPDAIAPDDQLQLRDDVLLAGADDGRDRVFVLAERHHVLFDDPALIPFARGLLEGRPFTAKDAMGWGGYPWERVRELLEVLRDERIVAHVPQAS